MVQTQRVHILYFMSSSIVGIVNILTNDISTNWHIDMVRTQNVLQHDLWSHLICTRHAFYIFCINGIANKRKHIAELWAPCNTAQYHFVNIRCLVAPSHYLNQCWLTTNKTTLREKIKTSTHEMNLKFKHLQPHILGTNELRHIHEIIYIHIYINTSQEICTRFTFCCVLLC